MKTEKTSELTAKWDAEQGMYVCRSLEIWSADGDNWENVDGTEAAGDEFDAAIIMLSGGPRDGVTVS